jgi:hypothetical protein
MKLPPTLFAGERNSPPVLINKSKFKFSIPPLPEPLMGSQTICTQANIRPVRDFRAATVAGERLWPALLVDGTFAVESLVLAIPAQLGIQFTGKTLATIFARPWDAAALPVDPSISMVLFMLPAESRPIVPNSATFDTADPTNATPYRAGQSRESYSTWEAVLSEN